MAFIIKHYRTSMLVISTINIYSRCQPCVPFSLQNVEIHTDSAKALADSLDVARVDGFPYFNTLLRILATRCMMQAVYFCSGMDSDFHHYGLASAIYTHFTSPIRRYDNRYFEICWVFITKMCRTETQQHSILVSCILHILFFPPSEHLPPPFFPPIYLLLCTGTLIL